MDTDHPAHAAFVYDSDAAYLAQVVSFLVGAPADQRLILIPLSRLWQDLSAHLANAGLDWQRAVRQDELVVIPAESVLEDVVPGGIFERRRFDVAVPRMFRAGVPHRVWGDAAGLLVSRDNLAAAIALEHAWTEVASERPLQLSCGYDLRFFSEEHDWPVRSVINGHQQASVQPGIPAGHLLPAPRDGGKHDPPLVLLWDDHYDTRDLYAEALTFGGYRVIVADTPAETIAFAIAYRPGLILMDVRLAEKRATEAMQTLRAQHEFTAPILAVTAHAFDAERETIFGAGFDEVLSKPCLPDQLVAHVTSALQPRAS